MKKIYSVMNFLGSLLNQSKEVITYSCMQLKYIKNQMYLNDSFHKVEILACEFPVKTVTLTHRTVSKKNFVWVKKCHRICETSILKSAHIEYPDKQTNTNTELPICYEIVELSLNKV